MEDALRQLFLLDCLNHDGDLTPMGQQLAKLPLDPGLGRVLVSAAQSGCLEEALSVCAMLSADSIFVGNRQVFHDHLDNEFADKHEMTCI